jgi:hypothetical protein
MGSEVSMHTHTERLAMGRIRGQACDLKHRDHYLQPFESNTLWKVWLHVIPMYSSPNPNVSWQTMHRSCKNDPTVSAATIPCGSAAIASCDGADNTSSTARAVA